MAFSRFDVRVDQTNNDDACARAIAYDIARILGNHMPHTSWMDDLCAISTVIREGAANGRLRLAAQRSDFTPRLKTRGRVSRTGLGANELRKDTGKGPSTRYAARVGCLEDFLENERLVSGAEQKIENFHWWLTDFFFFFFSLYVLQGRLEKVAEKAKKKGKKKAETKKKSASPKKPVDRSRKRSRSPSPTPSYTATEAGPSVPTPNKAETDEDEDEDTQDNEYVHPTTLFPSIITTTTTTSTTTSTRPKRARFAPARHDEPAEWEDYNPDAYD